MSFCLSSLDKHLQHRIVLLNVLPGSSCTSLKQSLIFGSKIILTKTKPFNYMFGSPNQLLLELNLLFSIIDKPNNEHFMFLKDQVSYTMMVQYVSITKLTLLYLKECNHSCLPLSCLRICCQY